MHDFPNMTAEALTGFIQTSLDELEQWRESQLSLDAGFGLVGASVGRVYRPWLYSLSADYYPGERVHMSGSNFDDIEIMAIELAKQIYHAKYADLHTLSSGSANSVVICALTGKGDTIMSMPDPLGHRSMRTDGIGEYLNRNYVDIPIDDQRMCIDLEAFEKRVLAVKPQLIMLGSALYLFNEPFREIKAIAQKVGAIVMCDVSHTLGFIHCSMSVNPLDAGVDLIAGGTYKTVCGPCKGMICTNDEKINKKIHDTALRMIFNYNAALIPGLAQALIELRTYGDAYGNQMIKNARALGAEMEELGFELVGADRNYTDTHMIAAKIMGTEPRKLTRRLADANILCSTVPGGKDHFYLRPATMIVTRRGFVEADMQVIAKMLSDIVHHDLVEKVAGQVNKLMKDPIRHIVHFSQH